MKLRRTLPLLAASLACAACFHQVVQTGLAAGGKTIHKAWVNTFIYGLVAAPEINTAKDCPTGVAVVETQQSFVNGLVGIVTAGIYTPQDVTITCAQGSASLPAGAREVNVDRSLSVEQRADVVDAAYAEAERSGTAVVIRF